MLILTASELQVNVTDVWSSSVLCRLTGFTIPPPVTSSGSVFSLRLTSDFAVSAHGFKVVYEGKKNIDFYSFPLMSSSCGKKNNNHFRSLNLHRWSSAHRS